MTITFLSLGMKVYKNAKSCRESAEELYYPTFYHMHNHLTGFWGFGNEENEESKVNESSDDEKE